jgi:transposase
MQNDLLEAVADIAEQASAQIHGNFTTKSDALSALILIARLCDAIRASLTVGDAVGEVGQSAELAATKLICGEPVGGGDGGTYTARVPDYRELVQAIAAAEARGFERGIREAAEAVRLLRRYRNETPAGHSPHMICHEADAILAKLGGSHDSR